MGGKETKPVGNGGLAIHVAHPKLQNLRLLQNGKDQQMQLTLGVDQKEYEKWKADLVRAKLDPEYLLLPKADEFNRKGLCGNSGTLKVPPSLRQINFDNYAYLLTDEIYNRKGKRTKFQEWELWYLLYTLSAAQNEMKSKLGSKIGDVRPLNVFLNSEGKVRVSNLLSWPREVSNFHKAFDN